MIGLNNGRLARTPVFCALLAIAPPAVAQDLGPASLFGLGETVLSESEDLLNRAPGMLDDLLKSAEVGRNFDTHEACLGALQVSVNAGAAAANVLPFSTVHTFEDARGPVGKFRMLMNGTKLHLEAFCVDKDLSVTMLPWGEGVAEPRLVSQSSFDATVGLLLLLRAQGAFEQINEPVAATEQSPLPKPDAHPLDGVFPPKTDNSAQARNSLTKPSGGEPKDEVADALREAMAPPMTSDERDAFRVAVLQCWNVGALSSEALRTTVRISFSLSRDARPKPESIRMIDFDGGNQDAADQVLESARRAIIRCGANGFKLPMEKYRQWSEVELTFNPENMRIR